MTKVRRPSSFKVEGNFGPHTKEATVTIATTTSGTAMFSVRPKFSREEFTYRLGDVAEMILWRALKAKATK